MAFVSFTADVVTKSRARATFKRVPEKLLEGIEKRCTDVASEMRCPRHQQNAEVLVDLKNPDHLEIEIVCCCNRFAKRVREALQKAASSTHIRPTN
jgi:hypothetical protein